MNGPALRRSWSGLRPVFFLTLLAAPVSGQGQASPPAVGGAWDTSMQFVGAEVDGRMGFHVATAGDLDGDGVPDILLGADTSSPGGLTRAGLVQVVSGVDGALLYELTGPRAGERLGHWTGGGEDLDGDGVPDLIAGAPFASWPGMQYAGAAYVYSGVDGSLLYSYAGEDELDQLGHSVTLTGDLDGDGRSEFLFGVPWAAYGSVTGEARVYSGATGQLLRRYRGARRQSGFGYTVANAGDVNGDGVPDQLIGAPGVTPMGAETVSDVYVYSGADGALLWNFHSDEIAGTLGWSIAGAGDLDLDGHDDLLIGARGMDVGLLPDAGRVFVYSGATGQVLYQYEGMFPNGQLGRNVAGVGDADGDGVPDFLISSDTGIPGGRPNAGWAYLHSGADGRLLWRIDGEAAQMRLGHFLAGLGDLDGDGLPEFAVTAPFARVGGLSAAGRVDVKSYSEVLSSSAATLSAATGGILRLDLDFPADTAGYRYRILMSMSGTGPTLIEGMLVPLTEDGLFLSTLAGQHPPYFNGSADGPLDSAGDATAELVLPAGQFASWVGTTFHFAAACYLADIDLRGCSVAVGVEVVP